MIESEIRNKPNKIPDKVIVELLFEELGFRRDAELPAHMPVGNLRRGLLTLLKAKEPKRFSKVKELGVRYRNSFIPDDKSLAEVGAWDGSTLELEKIGGTSEKENHWKIGG